MRVRNADEMTPDRVAQGSLRVPENVSEGWDKVFKNQLGAIAAIGSLIAFTLIVIWLHDDALGGGLGLRDSSGVTTQYFNWHPLLMSLAFLVCMMPAFLGFEVLPCTRNLNKNIHAVLNTCALIAAMAGLGIILDCHNTLTDSGSFHTVHGILGLITLILLVLNYFGGFFMYVLKLGGALRGSLKPLHKRMGLFCIMLGLATLCLGVQEKQDKSGLDYTTRAGALANAIGIIVILSLGAAVFSVAKFVDKKPVEAQYKPINQAKNDTPNYTTQPL